MAKEINREIADTLAKMAESQQKTREGFERIAQGQGEAAKRAQEKLEKDDELLETNKKLLGVSTQRAIDANNLTKLIDEQQAKQDEMRKAIEAQGLNVEDSAEYQKEDQRLTKLKEARDQSTGAAAAEDNKKAEAKTEKMLGYLKSTAGFLGGIAKKGMEKVKSGLEGFSKFAFGALAIAALAFLNSPLFDKYYDILVDKVIPLALKIYEKYLKPLLKFMKEKLVTTFEDVMKFLDGEIDAFDLLWNNKVVIAGFLAVFAPGVVLAPLKLGAGLIAKKLSASYAAKALTPFLTKLSALIGPAALIGGVIMAVKDGLAGSDLSKEIGVSKFSGFFGHLLGGMESGISGAFSNMGKFALIGAGIGSFIPVVGTVIGGLLGALLGGVLGYIGGENISKGIEKLKNAVFDFFAGLYDEIKAAFGFGDEASKKKREARLHADAVAIQKKALQNEEKALIAINKGRQRNLEALEKAKKKRQDAIDAGRSGKSQESFIKIEEVNLKRRDEQERRLREAIEKRKANILKLEKGAPEGVKKAEDASKLKPDPRMGRGFEIDARDQKVIKIDNKEEKTFVGATNMRGVDDAAAVLAQVN